MTLDVRCEVSLKALNTLALDAIAEHYVRAESEDVLREALALAKHRNWPITVLGGGSNVVLQNTVPGLVIHMATAGFIVLEDDDAGVVIEAAAGEPWHPFVVRTLEMGAYGLENLSLIPGTVGAAPVQNIGAYGVELKDVFAGLTAYDRYAGQFVEMDAERCAFGYRDSCFKHDIDRWVILRVRFRLSREPSLHLEYGPIRDRLNTMGTVNPTPLDVSKAVCAIRREKLPDPSELANAGSFFKNPVITDTEALALKQRYPDLVSYPQAQGVKVAAGWLIDKAGWRGFRQGGVGVHRHQALVLVNYGGTTTGDDVLSLAGRIQQDIRDRFGIELEMEPRII
ncbi:UDP-N-acetylmuramate dehydrogenase [Pseudomonas sp. Marseille-QA0892]